MVGRGGIEPPTPGFSVLCRTPGRLPHSTSSIAIRGIARSPPSGLYRWRRVNSVGTVQVRGKSPRRARSRPAVGHRRLRPARRGVRASGTQGEQPGHLEVKRSARQRSSRTRRPQVTKEVDHAIGANQKGRRPAQLIGWLVAPAGASAPESSEWRQRPDSRPAPSPTERRSGLARFEEAVFPSERLLVLVSYQGNFGTNTKKDRWNGLEPDTTRQVLRELAGRHAWHDFCLWAPSDESDASSFSCGPVREPRSRESVHAGRLQLQSG